MLQLRFVEMVVLIISIERFRGRLKFVIFIPHSGGKKTLISFVLDALTQK